MGGQLDEDIDSIRELLRELRILRSHWAIRPFMEAYQVVADVLATSEESLDRKATIDRSMALGKQYRLQNRIAAEESVSKVLFESACQLAENRGLHDEDCAPEEIRAFGDEIRDVLRRIVIVDALATRRWAGH